MDWPLRAKTCPAWVDANDGAKGYYRVEYQGGLLASLASGDVQHRLNAAERVDLVGNVRAMASGGKMPMGAALQLAEAFHDDPSRQVVAGALFLALSVDSDVVPESLRPNYERFLRKDFQERARQLGWTSKPGESDDVRLLRPTLVGAVARTGGDQDLAKQARELAERWLTDRNAIQPDVVSAVLSTAAYYGDLPLFNRLLAEFKKTQDRQEQEKLLGAMLGFRDRAAIELGMREVVSGGVKLVDGLPLLFGGQASPATRKMAFEFVKAHFDEIVKGNPSVFGTSLGAILPNAGGGLCDAESRKELAAYFTPQANRFDGAPRNLAQALERVDLCIARAAAQRPSVSEFLANY
jgi:alanyl aminopeptidase